MTALIQPETVALPQKVVLRPNIPVPEVWNLTAESRSHRPGVSHDGGAQRDTKMAFLRDGGDGRSLQRQGMLQHLDHAS